MGDDYDDDNSDAGNNDDYDDAELTLLMMKRFIAGMMREESRTPTMGNLYARGPNKNQYKVDNLYSPQYAAKEEVTPAGTQRLS